MISPIVHFEQLLARTRELAKAKGRARAVLIGADDPVCLPKAIKARDEGLIEPILIGAKGAITEIASRQKLNLDGLTVIDSDSRSQCATNALKLVDAGDIDFLIRGNIPTGFLMSRFFERPAGLRQGKARVSHVAVFEHQKYPRLLFMSDGGVSVAPGISEKVAIIENAVGVARLFGIDTPRVAMLAAVEVIYPGMPVTIEGAVISKMVDKGQIRGCYIDGPLSMDVATVPEAAQQKGATSEVAGRADIIIAPNIETGNGIYKAMAIFGKAKTAGIIVGGKVPIAIYSRSDSAESVFNSLILGGFVSLSGK